MKLLTSQLLASAAAERWKVAYLKKDGTWQDTIFGSSKLTHEKLVALGPCPKPEQVTEAIGNESWVDLKCDECGQLVNEVMQVGQEPDYESSTAMICRECLKQAAVEIEQ